MRKEEVQTIDPAALENVTGGVNWPRVGRAVLKWGDRIAEGINLAGIGTEIWKTVRGGGGESQPSHPQPSTPAR